MYATMLTDPLQMGAGANPEQMATMLDDPNMAQMMNEALNNPQMVDMLINNIPALRNNPQAREIIRASFEVQEYRPRQPAAWDEAYSRFEQLVKS